MTETRKIVVFSGAIGPMRLQLSRGLEAHGFEVCHTISDSNASYAVHIHLAEPSVEPSIPPNFLNIRRHIMLSSISARLAADNDPAKRAYGFEMLDAEASLKAELSEAHQLVILRKPVVYGADLPGSFLTLARLIKKGFPLPLGLANAARCYLSISNLSDLMMTLANASDSQWEAGNGIAFEPHDGAGIKTGNLVEAMAVIMNTKSRLVPVPPVMMSALGAVTNRKDQVRAFFEPLICVNEPSLLSVFGWASRKETYECLGFLRDLN